MNQPAPAVRQLSVDESSDGQRLDNFLLKTLKGVPKSHVYRVIRSGEVRVNKGRAAADTRLGLGDVVRIPPVRVAAIDAVDASANCNPTPPRSFTIVHEDDSLLVIDKPAGVAVHGGSGISFGVIELLRQARPEARFLELVHRLDKETSGLLMLAKKRSTLTRLQESLRDHRGDDAIRKTYSAIVWGVWPARLKVIDAPLLKGLDDDGERHVRVVAADHADARRAITLVNIAKRLDRLGLTLLDVTLKTGRTHQIRVHLAHSGHAIVGDPKYGDRLRNRALARELAKLHAVQGVGTRATAPARMALHARELTLTHPTTGVPLHLVAPLPAEWAIWTDLHDPARADSTAR